MPSIASRLDTDPQTKPTGVSTAVRVTPPAGFNASPNAPSFSPVLRSPLPNVGSSASPDNLRQYYLGGAIPQYRLIPAEPLIAAPKSSAGINGTFTTAKLTTGGTEGSITLTNGIVTAFVSAT